MHNKYQSIAIVYTHKYRTYQFVVDPSSLLNSKRMVEYTIDSYQIQPIRVLVFSLHSSPITPIQNLRQLLIVAEID